MDTHLKNMNTSSNDNGVRYIALFLLLCLSSELFGWGFFGHKLINQQAVYSLPLPLQRLFLPHQEYLSIHAVDPDKRRYAIKEEAFQHYFDTEKWTFWMDTVAVMDRRQLLRQVGHLAIVGDDTSWIHEGDILYDSIIAQVPRWFSGSVWDYESVEVLDTMAFHGLLPITLNRYYHKLVRAFQAKDMNLSLKCAAELGHYLGDAHVPLHTTENYNGQLTNQVGIHALWETHVPELLAESTFDWIVGPAQYLDDIPNASWSIVQNSHSMVDSVLTIESEVRNSVHDADESCFRDRGDKIVKLPCEDFLNAYEVRMSHMVERQMRKSILSVASFWWSAYVDAGQPSLGSFYVDDVREEKLPVDEKGRCD